MKDELTLVTDAVGFHPGDINRLGPEMSEILAVADVWYSCWRCGASTRAAGTSKYSWLGLFAVLLFDSRVTTQLAPLEHSNWHKETLELSFLLLKYSAWTILLTMFLDNAIHFFYIHMN